MRSVGRRETASEPFFDPWQIPLTELIQTQRAKVADLDLSVEPQVCVSWSESDDLLPMATGDFKDHFCHPLAKNAERCGFTQLRAVQQAIIPFLNYGCNLCLATGGCSGKTVGYLIPVIQKVYDNLQKCPRRQGYPLALIIVPTREKGKETFNILRMLTDGLGINICLSIMGMESSHYHARDRADITIMSHRTLFALLQDSRMNLGLLKFLVLEGVDDMHAYKGNGIVWLREVLKHYDENAKANHESQMVFVAEDVSFLDSDFCKDRVYHGNNTVVIDNGDQRLSPSNHLLLRVNKNTMAKALLQLIQNYDQGKAVIVFKPSDNQLLENEVTETLDSAGIPYLRYRKRIDICSRTDIQRRFAQGERKVLIVPYCNQLRSLRFPGITQIIHVDPPFEEHATYEASYNFSASCVAFNRRARSVVLFHVNNDYHARLVARIAETIRNCQTVGWPRNHIPQWAAEFVQGKRSWNMDDANAGEELWDLKEASFVSSERTYATNGPPADHTDQGKGCHRDVAQNWDYGTDPPNVVDSSFISSPSPAPIGDVYRSYNQPQNYSQYPNPPQQQTYAYREKCSVPQRQDSRRSADWNDPRSVDPSRPNERLQDGSRFQKPDEMYKYDDFEEENIGYREFRSCNSSRDIGRDGRPSSLGYGYQERYYQDEYSESPYGGRQEYNFGR